MQYSKHILSTRPLEQGLILKAAQKNVVIDTVSLIETKPVLDETLQWDIIRLAARPVTVAITSINAAKAVVACLQGRLTSWSIFTIGTATKAYVCEHFGGNRIAGTAGNALSLAGLVAAEMPEEIFFFCGDRRRDELPAKLAAEGIRVQEIIVYKTVYTAGKISKLYDGILFFSPGAVQHFFSVNTIASATVLFAIGSTTAAGIRGCSSNAVVVSSVPEAGALVDIAVNHLFKTNTFHEGTTE